MRRRRVAALACSSWAVNDAFIVQPGVVPSNSDYTELSRTRSDVVPAVRMQSSSVGASGVKPAACLELEISSCMIPHPAKAAKGGEDAFFVLDEDMGVFDGVGGWAARGHDPGHFTRGFAEAAAANITAQRLDEAISLRRSQERGTSKNRLPRRVDLQQALEHAAAHAPGMGTCTACVVSFDQKYGVLSGLNVGDSGALLVRRDRRGTRFVALRSETQRHRFNQPYQLGTASRDHPQDAEPFRFFVREGDVVVLATDGLLDNLNECDIVECISETSDADDPMKNCTSPAARLANALAHRASETSQDKDRVTPWEEEAVAAGIVPARASEKEPPVEGGWAWQAAQLGMAFERAVLSGVESLRRDSEQSGGTPEVDVATKSQLPDETVLKFRGGKVDDITVVVATVHRVKERRSSVEDREVRRRKPEQARETVVKNGPRASTSWRPGAWTG